MKLSGKTAVVTGGGSGIGRAIAVALAQEGCHVAIAGRQEAKLRQVVAEHGPPPRLIAHQVDVADRQSVDSLFAWATEQLGPIDILVNSAGINVPHRSLAETLPEEWDQLLAVNATGAYNCLRAVLPTMRKRQAGLVVNISSIAGKRASQLGGIAYSASKFAMTALGTAAALDEGAHGIRVTNIYPGEVDTPILDSRPTVVTPEHRQRILQSEDVAAAVLMVACLPPRAHVAELVIKPTWQDYA